MPDTLANSIPANHLPPCSHRTQRGKRCRLPALDATRGLCFRHAGLHTQEADSGDLSAELLAELDNLQSAQQVNRFLARLLEVLTKNRIATKRAAVLTYICAQILRTMPAIVRELDPPLPKNQQIIFDLPRPIRD